MILQHLSIVAVRLFIVFYPYLIYHFIFIWPNAPWL
jgi:hypothetical protein